MRMHPLSYRWLVFSTLIASLVGGSAILASDSFPTNEFGSESSDVVQVTTEEGLDEATTDVSQSIFFEDEQTLGKQIRVVSVDSEAWTVSSKSTCDGSCDSLSGCDSCRECCTPWWAHRNGGFGEFLLLRPGSTDIVYTVEQNGVIPGGFPTGPVGQVNIDENVGYRVGFSLAHSDCQSVMASFTSYEGDSRDTIVRQGGNFLNSQVIHPSTLTVGGTSLQSTAAYSIDFQLVDLAFRRALSAGDCHVLNWFGGLRYANLEQNFIAAQEVSVATGLVTVDTDVDFDGFGLELGLDGVRRDRHTGLLVYSRGLASIVGGTWSTDYVQTPQLAGGIVANSSEDYRLTPIVELEFGVGWQSKCGRVKATAGYLTNAWYNAVSTRTYIRDFRAGKYDDFNETITFDGLTARVEVGF